MVHAPWQTAPWPVRGNTRKAFAIAPAFCCDGRNVKRCRGHRRLLDGITLYWLTGRFGGPFLSAFPGEIYKVPRRWAETAYPNLFATDSPTKAATSPPGNSRKYSAKRFAPVSDRCGAHSAPNAQAVDR
jgi:hypothetical protein